MATNQTHSKPSLFQLVLLVAALLLVTVVTVPAAEAPDTITLNVLAELYEPVVFDHAMHADVAECAICHHQTTGQPEAGSRCVRCHSGNETNASVACRDCHVAEPFSADYMRSKEVDSERYHIDMPGLKGAYHLSCLGCHTEMGAPTGCQECHARTAAGDETFRADAQAPTGGNSH
jgi:hypothetical protein